MQIIVSTTGTIGDVLPLLGLATRLAERGHRVVMLANEHFGDMIRTSGIEPVPILTAESYRAFTQDHRLWHRRKGIWIVLGHCVLPSLRPVYEAVRERYVEGETVLVSHWLDFGSRLAQEKLGVPQATVHLAPGPIRSAHQPPVMPAMFTRVRAPKWFRRLQYRMLDHFLDQLCEKEINACRAEIGLPPMRRFFDRWCFSPDRAIAMFPEWYCPRPPDWPPQTRMCGFPLWDPSREESLPDEVQEFLDQGEKPIVFTAGTGMAQGERFFQAAAEACQMLGRRGMLLTRYSEQLPAELPPGVEHFSYVPFGTLLPHSAALVHHGGVGTLSQAMAAGIPQVVMPMTFDQPDNAARLRQLGVGEAIPPEHFSAASVAFQLDKLLRSDEVRRKCAEIVRRIENTDALGDASDLVEELGRRHAAAAPVENAR